MENPSINTTSTTEPTANYSQNHYTTFFKGTAIALASLTVYLVPLAIVGLYTHSASAVFATFLLEMAASVCAAQDCHNNQQASSEQQSLLQV